MSTSKRGAPLNISPERRAQLKELREKVCELFLAGKRRQYICAELGITKSDYHNQLAWLRKRGLVSFVQRETALIGPMPKPPSAAVADPTTPDGLRYLQQIVQEKARPVLSRMKWLHDHATDEHEQQVKMAVVWKDLFANLWPKQQQAAPSPGSGLTIVFNNVNRGPKRVGPIVETTATPVETNGNRTS